MAIQTLKPIFVVKNTSTSDTTVIGAKIKAGQTIDLLNSVPGLTESQVIEALRAPNGEIYVKQFKGVLSVRGQVLNTFQVNDATDEAFTINIDPRIGHGVCPIIHNQFEANACGTFNSYAAAVNSLPRNINHLMPCLLMELHIPGPTLVPHQISGLRASGTQPLVWMVMPQPKQIY